MAASFVVSSTDADVVNEFRDQAEGKTFVITGPSQYGIGAQVALSLASVSPRLIIFAGRDAEKVAPVMEEIASINAEVEVQFVELNLLSIPSVRSAAKSILELAPQVDFLINNAGISATREIAWSEDAVESQFAVNYLGPWLLTNILIKEGALSAGAVVVNVGSLAYQLDEVHADDLYYGNGETYNGWRAHGQSKSALLLGTRRLAARTTDAGIVVLAAHPGVTSETRYLANAGVDEEYYGEAYAIALERKIEQPALPPQAPVSIGQAAGVVLNTALNPNFRDVSGSFIVENEVYNDLLPHVLDDEVSDFLEGWSHRLIGEEFTF